MQLHDLFINVAAEMPESVANGPGLRYVLWVQGCRLSCPGCFNPDFQPLVNNRLVSVASLLQRILELDRIEGVTFTGGEPVLQARSLYYLAAELKRRGLSIVCFSGYTLAELEERGPYTRGLLAMTDILIDGRYERNRRAPLLWRGSSNQRVHFLSERYAAYSNAVETGGSQVEITVGARGMWVTGMMEEAIIRNLEGEISAR